MSDFDLRGHERSDQFQFGHNFAFGSQVDPNNNSFHYYSNEGSKSDGEFVLTVFRNKSIVRRVKIQEISEIYDIGFKT